MAVVYQYRIKRQYGRAGGSVKVPWGMGAGTGSAIYARYAAILPTGKITVAGYSYGCKALYALLNATKQNDSRLSSSGITCKIQSRRYSLCSG